VSLLPPPFYAQIEGLWKTLEDEFGLTGMRVTPYPHFSWQIAQNYDLEHIERIMTGVVSTVTPFTIRTTGLGIFTGPRPVVFIALVKNAALMSFHKMLWDLTRPFSSGLSPLYSPEYWMPHISLVYEGTNTINIAGLMQKLAFQPFVWEMSIDNLALIYQENGKAGKVKYQYNFST